MKAVVDTNVAISAAINPHGPPGEVILLWEVGSFTWITSPALVEELDKTFHAPEVSRYFTWQQSEVDDFFTRIHRTTELVEPANQLTIITADLSDNRVLEAAVEGEADYIVSGDRHLLDLKSHEGTEIVTPAQFLAILAEARNP